MKLKTQNILFVFLCFLLGVQFAFAPAQTSRFTDDGLMIIESSRYLDNIPPTHQIIYDFGETTFKLSDNATPQTKNLLMVKYGDDVKIVNGVGKVTSQQIDDFLLTTKQGNKSKEKLILLT